jgi:hypothetical protein
MAVINKSRLKFQEDNIYFQKFVSTKGDEFGLRFGEPKDAKDISMMYQEAYGYDYVHPVVYDLNHLKKELADKNHYWFVGEKINDKEIAGAGLLEIERNIVKGGKAVTRKKFQGQGITTKIGAAGVITVLKMPQFKNALRLDFEARGLEVGSQKLAQNSGSLPYCLIPAYANFGDRRQFKIKENKPFPSTNNMEAVFLYSIIFKTLWRKREKKVYLLDNEDIIFYYEYVKKMQKRMQHDDVILEPERYDKGYELYGVSKDLYMGIVDFYGFIKENSLKHLLETYKNWRIILWRIPTNNNGISSMTLALNSGFNMVGYDIGFNNMNGTFVDSVIMACYPNGGSQNLEVIPVDNNKPLLDKAIEVFCSRMN